MKFSLDLQKRNNGTESVHPCDEKIVIKFVGFRITETEAQVRGVTMFKINSNLDLLIPNWAGILSPFVAVNGQKEHGKFINP